MNKHFYLALLFEFQTNGADVTFSKPLSGINSPILAHFSPRKSNGLSGLCINYKQFNLFDSSSTCIIQTDFCTQCFFFFDTAHVKVPNNMTAVSNSCTQIQLKNVHISSSNPCSPRETQQQQPHHQPQCETNCTRRLSQSGSQPATTSSSPAATSIQQRGSVDHSTVLFHKPTSPPTHQASCSSDSDATTTTTTSSPSATAMRRLYFKTAKLSRTTQNSITALHQQAQHVPKVSKMTMDVSRARGSG